MDGDIQVSFGSIMPGNIVPADEVTIACNTEEMMIESEVTDTFTPF